MAVGAESEPEQPRLACEIRRILDESRQSQAIHNRKLKELAALYRSSPSKPFFQAFIHALSPVFDFPRRTISAERSVRFAAAFASLSLKNDNSKDCETPFIEEFLRFLLVGAQSAHRPARFRSCQIISEIIMRLPDDAEVSDEVWDEVIEGMQVRAGDKIPAIRAFAIRALSRFADCGEDTEISDLFLQMLPLEQNTEVRKTIVLSLPSSRATIEAIIESTLDATESVRKSTYYVLASKFPLQTLSIKDRTTVLKRGLKDRSSVVKKECLKMLKDDWLAKCCAGDPINLLKFLDVESYEQVGEAVMEALLNDGVVNVQENQSMRQYIVCSDNQTDEEGNVKIQLMDAETALYWRVVCKHLQAEAQAKGSDAATTTGTEAAVYASEASDKNDLLEDVLPQSISDYVSLVNAHLSAGQNYHFTTRQLLLLGTLLDFSDTTTRKTASSFLHSLLLTPPSTLVDELGLDTSAGDGLSLGGDKAWAKAVAELAKKVHAAKGEFEEVVCTVIEDQATPVRERVGGFSEWMHCLSLVGFLLENLHGFWSLRGHKLDSSEILHSLLLPAAKQTHVEIQRATMRYLGLFGLLERRPSIELVKQLYESFINGSSPVRSMACKSLLDLVVWFGPNELNKSIGLESNEPKTCFNSLNGEIEIVDVLDLLYSGFEKIGDELEFEFNDEYEDENSVISVLGEGFAKLILLSKKLEISQDLSPVILSRLVRLYFSEETGHLQRLKQCLSVFFEHYPALSRSHKRCVSSTFLPVMRSMWPGMFGNTGGSSAFISKMRKKALIAARFMLRMIQTPLFSKEIEEENFENDFEFDEEGLAIRLASEVVVNCNEKTSASKAYISALCKIILMLRFRVSEQRAIKCMRGMINLIMNNVSHDKDLVREIARLELTLKSLDRHVNEELLDDEANAIFENLGIEKGFELETNVNVIPPTPMLPPSAKGGRSRARPTKRRTSLDSDSDDDGYVTLPRHRIEPMTTPSLASTRSQRASKAVTLSKLAASGAILATLDSDDEEQSALTD